MLESLPPYHVHLETWGEGFGDLAFWMDDFLVTDAFRNAFMQSDLKGLFGFREVRVVSHRQHGRPLGKPPRYFRTIPRVGGAPAWNGDEMILQSAITVFWAAAQLNDGDELFWKKSHGRETTFSMLSASGVYYSHLKSSSCGRTFIDSRTCTSYPQKNHITISIHERAERDLWHRREPG
jgi:hypothetical protein